MGVLPHTTQEGERPSPVLERQPPLPKTTPVRLVEHDEEGGHERALVPVTSYGEEVSYEPSEDKVHLRGKMMGGLPHVAQEGERPSPV